MVAHVSARPASVQLKIATKTSITAKTQTAGDVHASSDHCIPECLKSFNVFLFRVFGEAGGLSCHGVTKTDACVRQALAGPGWVGWSGKYLTWKGVRQEPQVQRQRGMDRIHGRQGKGCTSPGVSFSKTSR